MASAQDVDNKSYHAPKQQKYLGKLSLVTAEFITKVKLIRKYKVRYKTFPYAKPSVTFLKLEI